MRFVYEQLGDIKIIKRI